MDQPSELVKCPKCNDYLRKSRLNRHLKKVHNPQAELLRQEAERERIAENRLVVCPFCNCQIRNKKLFNHCKVSHRRLPTQVKQAMNIAKNKFNSAREREAFWKNTLGPDTEENQQDKFEKKLILSGGVYGLGKSRNH